MLSDFLRVTDFEIANTNLQNEARTALDEINDKSSGNIDFSRREE